MIGAYANLSFNDFITNMGLPILLISFIIAPSLYLFMRKDLAKVKKIENFEETLRVFKEEYPLKHRKLLISSL